MTRTDVAADPTSVARQTLERLETAWNSADGAAFGNVYASNASFVTIRGDHIVGKAAIGAGHHGIFTTIYAGSVNRMELISATEISEGRVLSVSRSTLDCPAGPLAGRHHAMSTSVLAQRDDGDWAILATQNTLVAGH